MSNEATKTMKITCIVFLIHTRFKIFQQYLHIKFDITVEINLHSFCYLSFLSEAFNLPRFQFLETPYFECFNEL